MKSSVNTNHPLLHPLLQIIRSYIIHSIIYTQINISDAHHKGFQGSFTYSKKNGKKVLCLQLLHPNRFAVEK